MEVVTFLEGELSCYRGGQFKDGREWSHVTVVVTLMEAKRSCYRGGQFNGSRMVMLQR